jgi:hypothetical protein
MINGDGFRLSKGCEGFGHLKFISASFGNCVITREIPPKTWTFLLLFSYNSAAFSVR